MSHTDYKKKYFNGSMTVEAACIMPVILTVFLFMVWMFDALRTHSLVDAKLAEIGHNLVASSYPLSEVQSNLFSEGADSDTKEMAEKLLSFAFSETYVRSQIESLDVASKITNLSVGFSNIGTDGEISLCALYKVKPYISVGNIGGIWLKSTYFARECVGYERENEITQETIYISTGEEVYHTSPDCSALKADAKEILSTEIEQQRNSDGSKYYPCSICKEDVLPTYVYVTDYGTRYHCDGNCYNLRRTIIEIPLSEVGSRRKCLLCP